VAVAERSRSAVGIAAAARRAPKDHYAAFAGKRNASNGFAFSRFSHDLWAPFRYEATAGVYNPRKAAASALCRPCIELDERGNFLHFYGVCAQIQPTGIFVYAFSHESNNLGGQLFTGATDVEMAIEADGANMIFQGRPRGSDTWTTLATIPFAGQTVPLLPAAGAGSMSPGSEVALDNLRIVFDGKAPDNLRPEQRLARRIWAALLPQIRGVHELDGNPDYQTAAGELESAAGLMQAAVNHARDVDIGNPQLSRTVLKTMLGAQKTLGAVTARTKTGRGAAQSYKKLKASIGKQVKAVDSVYPPGAAP
jgi:hypothetical protein